MKKIWCLFDVANEYNQPDYNLVAWWAKKPTEDQINVAVQGGVDKEKLDELMQHGETKIIYGPTYRIEEIEEGHPPTRTYNLKHF